MASPYEVAIHLTVSGNAQAGLAAAGQQINKLNEGVEKLHKAFALLFVGGEMKRWGEDALGFVKKMLDAAGNFQHVQSQMFAMGMNQKEIAASVDNSWDAATKKIHIGVQDIAEMNRHAVEIFGSAGGAAEHMPLMEKLADFQAKWGAGKTGLKQVDVPMAIRDMMKTTEGAAMLSEDPKKFDVFAEKLMRAVIAAGGNVSASQILTATRHARGAQFGWSDEFRFGVFPALVQEYGPAAGTSAYQSFKKLGAGVSFDKTGIVQGIEMGLINPKKVEYDKVGRPMRLMPGALYYSAEMTENPFEFTKHHITPWLNEHTKNVGERTAAIVRLLGKATGMTNIQAFDLQSYKLKKDIGLFGQARMEMPDDYAQALLALQKKWEDFTVALGTPSLKLAAEALGGMTKAIISITGAINENPGAARNFLAIASGFGTAMTALGALAVSAGMIALLGSGGIIIAGITALTGVLAGLAAANWPTINSKFQEFLDSLRGTDWNAEITKALIPIIAAIKSLFTNLGTAILDALKGMWEDMKKAFGGLFQHINFAGGGFGGGGMGSSGALSAGERGQYADAIRRISYQEGADPTPLLKIYGAEGARAWFGDGGHSIGPFQFYDKGEGAKYHGRRDRSVAAVEDMTRYMLRYGREHGGWPSSVWHGLRDQGIGSLPYRSRHGGGETHVHNNIYLDGKMIAKSTSKHFVRAAQYATSVGRADGRGVFMGPGFEQFS